MNITITTPLESKYYGVYDNLGTWTQASGTDFAEALAVLDAVTTVAGSFSGTVYEDTDTVDAIDTDVDIDVEFTPIYEAEVTGYLTVDAADSTVDGEMTGEGFEPTILSVTPHNDIALFFDEETADIDINLTNFDFYDTEVFDTLIETLLFTDGRADKYQVLDPRKRRGWVGDYNQTIYKSKVWLKDQSRLTRTDLNEISDYAKEALEYMTLNKIVDKISVTAEIISGVPTIEIILTIGNEVVKKYVPIWRAYNELSVSE